MGGTLAHQPSFDELLARGVAAARAGKTQAARVMLQQAIRINPRSAEAWLWLARIEDAPDKRRSYLEVALKLDPDNADARRLLKSSSAPKRGADRSGEARLTPITRPPRRDLAMLAAWALLIAGGVAVGALALMIVASRPDAVPILFPPTPTNTHTPTATYTPSLTPTHTLTPTLTPSPTPTPTPTLTPTLTPSPTPTPPSVSRLLYTSERDGDFEIYIMDENGVELAQLTDNDADEFSPKFSPDGRRIAFVSNRDGDAEIYVMNVDGSDVIQLTDNAVEDHSPVWSPDGRMLAFYSEREGNNGELYLLAVDSDYVRRLTNNERADYHPAWWPGRRIAFASNRGDDGGASYDLYVMDATGQDVAQLTESDTVNWYPDWSPACAREGANDPPCRLAWTSFNSVSSAFEIFVMDASGFNLHQVTTAEAFHGYPVWSPDGTRVAFTSDRGESQDIFTAAVDCPADPVDCEATVVQLTHDPAPEVVSDWKLIPR